MSTIHRLCSPSSRKACPKQRRTDAASRETGLRGKGRKPLILCDGAESFSVQVGDKNGDGHLDLVLANQGDDTASILLGDGKGGPGRALRTTPDRAW